MRRVTGETLMSAFGLLILIGVLVAFDPRVRDQVSTIGARDGSVAGLTATATDIGSAVFQSARDQSLDHAPMLVFGVVAAVLVTFMLRT